MATNWLASCQQACSNSECDFEEPEQVVDPQQAYLASDDLVREEEVTQKDEAEQVVEAQKGYASAEVFDDAFDLEKITPDFLWTEGAESFQDGYSMHTEDKFCQDLEPHIDRLTGPAKDPEWLQRHIEDAQTHVNEHEHGPYSIVHENS